ncbi:SPOR domain-containing protein [Marinomonas ostreistagni]|uniref:SPOR domain-containing protein n=1 Tax=Marinomonas ostreistagni TaxID=359209 RepID=UPI0019502932|nr:SPOR domain-containing protein [Marinomonas ostreistagni]MBM6550122.1 SPOR domain-containing protein [Marinomonas ostreistagni]
MLDTKSKYRLIGAGLLIASSAILLPLVLDGERPEELNVDVTMPAQPTFPEVEVAPVQSMDELAQETEQERTANDIQLLPEPQQATTASNDAPAPKPTPEPAPAPKAEPKPKPTEVVKKEVAPVGERWTLQVATFGQKANAERTLNKLKEAGYPAYVMTSNSLFKVFVGPELERSASEKVKTKVQREFKLSGIVVKYSPNS